MSGKIFISYRRSGSPKDANLVFHHLSSVFGAEQVFMDVSGIRPGDDFVEVLEQQLADCTVLLALIGPDWLQARNEHGERKLDDEDDFVRVEIRTALQRRMRVVPLLLDGAPMPRKVDLPEDLHPMARRHWLAVDATNLHNFRSAMGRLEEVLRESLAAGGLPWMDVRALSRAAIAVAGFRATHRPSEPWMSDEGRDEFGRWAEICINSVVQRLRWIEPGEFWMGSTQAELKQFGEQGDDDWKRWIANEAPRHRVKLTQGFWLADTACTQALWQTVVGDNPSHFTADLNLPVEKVSWVDVTQKFLPALNRQLAGAEAFLPTEAQWEFACRAGTETSYHFGERIEPDQVNCADFSSAEEAGGSSIPKQTLRVKSLPPNAWGLYEMHGNVWEWCVESLVPYSKDFAVNPAVLPEGFERALRGGSWEDSAARVRAACRGRCHHGGRWNNIGFRVLVGTRQAYATTPRRRVLHKGLDMLNPPGL